jgi:hypothetical protein
MNILRMASLALARTDFDAPTPARDLHFRDDLDGPIMRNGLNAVLQTGNAIPGVSFFTGIATMGLGALLLADGLSCRNLDLSPMGRDIQTVGTRNAISGIKSLALGASAAFVPFYGNYLNAAAAVKDGADTLNWLALRWL